MAEAQAFVTLATTDAYSMGCLVVGKSLRRHGTSRKLVAMVSPNVSRASRLALEDVFDEVVVVDVLDSRDETHLTWLQRPELGVTFTKLHCWTLTQYRKCVFLDADTLVLCNVDELFEYEELSAAPDPGWPDCFNSGVFVFRPSLNTHTQILEHAAQHGSFDGGDQGILNSFFSDWAVKDIRKHLPFVYNLTAGAIYTYLPAFQQFGHHAKIVHFLGGTKPWQLPYDPQAASESSLRDSSKNFQQFMNLWWVEYYSQRQLQFKKDDKNEDYQSVQQLVSPQTHQTPSQSQKSSTEAHHRDMLMPSLPLAVDSLTISSSSSEKSVSGTAREMKNILYDVLSGGETPVVSPPSEHTEPETTDDSATAAGEANILYDVLSGGETPVVSPPSEHTEPETTDDSATAAGEANILYDVLSGGETPVVSPPSEHTEPETTDDSATAAGEAAAGEAEMDDLEHRRMWEEGRADYMGKDAFNNIMRKLDQFLD
ncbi:glycogenin-2 isoform X1 [Carassius carassius]|uniref:glycogenin-2 isoform X1 n=1 Tax=Carassius carassius TaxID=217509 RepID=UPI002868F050|nr:glycogenin-2 isoform X1 [Carassius carassius]